MLRERKLLQFGWTFERSPETSLLLRPSTVTIVSVKKLRHEILNWIKRRF